MTRKERKPKTYQQRKQEARAAAIRYQLEESTRAQSWGEVAESSAHFEKIARWFGLVREFKEEGII